MLSVQEITRRRMKMGNKTTLLQQPMTRIVDNNNNAQKVTDKPKEKSVKKKNPRKIFFFLPGKKSKHPKTDKVGPDTPTGSSSKSKNDTPAKVSLVQFYTDEIAGESVIINKHHLYSTDDEEDFTIVIRDDLTPENYLKTIDYYRHINSARQTYTRAAIGISDYLSNHQSRGEWEEWLSYRRKQKEDKIIWHQKCRLDNEKREREVRRSDDIKLERFCDRCKRIGETVCLRCYLEVKDIFPCCFND